MSSALVTIWSILCGFRKWLALTKAELSLFLSAFIPPFYHCFQLHQYGAIRFRLGVGNEPGQVGLQLIHLQRGQSWQGWSVNHLGQIDPFV